MQQRRPRLGDILDDYCPRERRITNHAVVAMIEDTVKQTRCTTCDADHEYKQAKVPAARRKASAPAAQLVDATRAQASLPDAPGPEDALDEAVPVDDAPLMAGGVDADGAASGGGESAVTPEEQVDVAASDADTSEPADDEIEESQADREGWGHRPLIRATLPRPEGHTPERKAPDFTFRPAGGKFDANRNNGQRHRGGHRQARQAQGYSPSGQGGSRFGGQRGPGQGQGGGPQGRQGNRQGQGGGGRPGAGPGPGQGRGPRPGGGRKRGR